MAILSLSQVSQSFGAFDLFSGVTANIPNGGKVGLVGPNGVGKTTLLLVLTGRTTPASGSIHVARGTKLGYLTQEAEDAFGKRDHSVYAEMLTVFDELRETAVSLQTLETAMAGDDFTDDMFDEYSKLQEQFELDGGYDYERRIQRILSGLGFTPESWQTSLVHLSGGQKTRALLARLLLKKPDLLILDEPTNHLDVQAIEWLEGMLKTWEGALLIVSHDRYFLDKVVSIIWEMSPVGIESYRGNYSAYLMQRQERWERKQIEFNDFKEVALKEMDFIRRNIAGQRTQMAQGKLSRLAREVSVVQAGGLGLLATLRSKGWLWVSANLNLASPDWKVGELHSALGSLRSPAQPPTLQMRLPASHRSGRIVLRTKNLEVGFPGAPLFSADDMELHRLEIAALMGPNGSGKTTLLRTVLNDMPPLAGEVIHGASLKAGYFSQAHDELDPNNSLLDELLRHKPMPISAARNYLARFLFRGDDVYNKVHTLSGGERARLALSILVLEGANLLLLDEPSNHLDLPAQEELQLALEAFDGTILLVSHDRYLIDRLATQIWSLDNGRLNVHSGSYQSYLAKREQAKVAAVAVRKKAEPKKPTSNGTGLSKNEQRKRQAKLQAIEDQIQVTEDDILKLGEAMQAAAQSQDFDAIQKTSQEYAGAEEKLQALLADWEQIHE